MTPTATSAVSRGEAQDEGQRALYAGVREADLAREVRRLARLLGWRHYHSYLSLRSEPGFPDVVLVRPPRVIFAELKSVRGRLTVSQEAWLEALAGCPGAEAYQWRPQDLPAIARLLQDGPREEEA